jgi:hypothetical protein
MKRFSGLLANQPWAKYFESPENGKYHSELLKISQFFGFHSSLKFSLIMQTQRVI